MNGISFSDTQFGVAAPPETEMVRPGDGVNLWVLGMMVTLKVMGNGTRDAYSLIEHVVPPGRSSPVHLHLYEDESLYLLDGELIWTVKGKDFHAKTGSYMNLPKFVPHSFANTFDKPARLLVAFSPAGLEKWFLDVGTPATDIHQSPPIPTADDIANAVVKAKNYGIVFSDRIEEPPINFFT